MNVFAPGCFRLGGGAETWKCISRLSLKKKLNDMAALSGRAADELVQDAVAGLVDQLTEMLDGFYSSS